MARLLLSLAARHDAPLVDKAIAALPNGEGPMPTTVARDEVRRLLEAGAQLIDVLPAEEFAALHLPGARNIPLRQLECRAPAELDPARPVIVYCWGPQ
jgi:rhodanese-related sulfurtransferase